MNFKRFLKLILSICFKTLLLTPATLLTFIFSEKVKILYMLFIEAVALITNVFVITLPKEFFVTELVNDKVASVKFCTKSGSLE